jgi:serine phosphatase RsbU (regulator of sigma subunit)
VFEERVLPLGPGDRVFLHSDGLADAFSPDGRAYGAARLRDSVARHRHEPLKAAVAALLREVRAWSADAPHDDLSVLALAVG